MRVRYLSGSCGAAQAAAEIGARKGGTVAITCARSLVGAMIWFEGLFRHFRAFAARWSGEASCIMSDVMPAIMDYSRRAFFPSRTVMGDQKRGGYVISGV
jgi:hypothetical protein